MSEYQCYEFVALDRPLTVKQMAELRAISTRAEISATRFWNEYQWGDLKADPAKLVERYFDAHLYANWGTHRLMLRVPKARVAAKALKPYLAGSQAARLSSATDNVVLDLVSDTEEPDDDEESRGLLAARSPLRAELMRGDLRPAYLAWLLAVHNGEIDEDQVEPPVPADLAQLTAAQEAMVEFLRIDVDLVAAAASGSASAADDSKPFRRWVAALSGEDKAAWLRRAVDEPELALGSELLRAFRVTINDGRSYGGRTVAELQALAEARREERENAQTMRAKKAQEAVERARQGRLTKLSRDIDGAWAKLEKLVESSSYDEAMTLAVDLRELAVRDQDLATFAKRFEAMRRRQLRRRGFFDRWKSV
jgi:hypothetical protein